MLHLGIIWKESTMGQGTRWYQWSHTPQPFYVRPCVSSPAPLCPSLSCRAPRFVIHLSNTPQRLLSKLHSLKLSLLSIPNNSHSPHTPHRQHLHMINDVTNFPFAWESVYNLNIVLSLCRAPGYIRT